MSKRAKRDKKDEICFLRPISNQALEGEGPTTKFQIENAWLPHIATNHSSTVTYMK